MGTRPPMPALIPIAALRTAPKAAAAARAVNNNATSVCGPCVRHHQHQHQQRDHEDEPAEDDDDEEEEEEEEGDEGEVVSREGSYTRTEAVGVSDEDGGSGEAVTALRGVQRSRRRLSQAADCTAAAIDAGGLSRDRSGGPQAPARRARPDRHRKSDRRRHRSDRLLRKRSRSVSSVARSHTVSASESTNATNATTTSVRPPPRVNPIFVWVRQEDTRIVDVRCEDYDKRNRILLTKTAHGWRAIPRTETLASLDEAPASTEQQQQQHNAPEATTDTTLPTSATSDDEDDEPGTTATVAAVASTPEPADDGEADLEDADPVEVVKPARKARSRKSSKTKRLRPAAVAAASAATTSAAAPASSVTAETNASHGRSPSPAWSTPINIESHLPSHTIAVPRRLGDEPGNHGVDIPAVVPVVNSATECCASAGGGSGGTVGDVASPLDNLLAVAELEFKQHQVCTDKDTRYDIDQLNTLAELSTEKAAAAAAAAVAADKLDHPDNSDQPEHSEPDGEPEAEAEPAHADDCDYNDDDEHQMAMTDILDRLEQSLQSPMEDDDADDCGSYAPEDEMEEDEHAEPTDDAITVNENQLDDDLIDATDEPAEDTAQEVADDAVEEGVDDDVQEITEDAVSEAPEEVADNETEKTDDSEDVQLVAEYKAPKRVGVQVDQPTDLSVKSTTLTGKVEDVSEDEMPTDLSTRSKKEIVPSGAPNADDLQPTDLSIRKQPAPSPALRIDTPRPPSQNSETIQSPQPSGIPAVPPSPDIFPNKPSNKSLFLESLLSSASPKLALTPEVTITRNQKEPLDLGKSRKSASPTVSCSEEAKSKFLDGEPVSKRVKVEDITLKNLLEKQKLEAKSPDTVKSRVSSQVSSVETSRLLELLTSDSEPDPVTQFKQLLADNDANIPDPLLVPKERLSAILSSPGREIPKLLSQRPELRLPEALAFPQLLQDPDILVITLAQLQTILQKQNQPIALAQAETKTKEPKPIAEKPPKPAAKLTKPETPVSTHANVASEYSRYSQAQQHHQQLLEAQIKHHHQQQQQQQQQQAAQQQAQQQHAHQQQHAQQQAQQAQQQHHQQQQQQQQKEAALRSQNGLGSDMDVATAAFNHMLWLPYLNHLEAAAMACGNNPEFLKALHSAFPASAGATPYPPQMPELPPLFSAAAAAAAVSGRFGMPATTGFPGAPPPIDYANPLELAMWQEAMMQASMQAQQSGRPKMDASSMKMPPYREAVERSALLSKKYQQGGRMQSSARTSPISHNFQQRGPGAGSHPFLHAQGSYLGGAGGRHGLQIPQYNPAALTHQQQQALLQQQHQHQQQQQQQQQQQAQQAAAAALAKKSAAAAAAYRSSHSLKPDLAKQLQNSSYKYSQYLSQQARAAAAAAASSKQAAEATVAASQAQSTQKPRVTCKSLQNLLSPQRQQDEALKRLQERPPGFTQPMDLSGAKHQMFATAKLKVKQNLVEPFGGAKLWKHDDVPEVGSTTEEMTQLHEPHAALWHPLFGK